MRSGSNWRAAWKVEAEDEEGDVAAKPNWRAAWDEDTEEEEEEDDVSSGSKWRAAWMEEAEEEADVPDLNLEADGLSMFRPVCTELKEEGEAETSISSGLSRGPSGKYENLMEVLRLCKSEVVLSESKEHRMGLGGNLLEGPFEFVVIPHRTWSLVDPCDKLVAKGIALALSKVYDPLYSEFSHAFRPGKGCHSAMLQMKQKWRGINYFVKFNIKKCYDQMKRDHLSRVLREEIQDEKFVGLALKLYQTEVQVCHKLQTPPPETGFPRGSILGKVLCNVYLNRLDQHVAALRKEYESSSHSSVNDDDTEDDASDADSKGGSQKGGQTPEASLNAELRMRYVRYADEFLLGFTGPKPLWKETEAKILDFLKSELHLDAEKDSVVHVTSGHVRFLGMRIAGLPESKAMRRYAKGMEKRRRVKARIRQFAKQRQESWDIQLRNLILLSWSRAFKKARAGLASRMLTEHALHKKAREVAENFVIEKLEDGECKETVMQLLEKEKVDMMKIDWLGIPEEILEAHKNLTDTMQDFLDEEDRAEARLAAITPRVTNEVRALRRREYKKTIPLQLLAPMEEITDKLKKRGILTPKRCRPASLAPKTTIPDEEIVTYFASVAYGLHTYYRCCDNLINVRRLIDYQVRWSAIFTLAQKHKSSSRQVIQKHTRDLVIKKEGKVIAKYPSTVELVRNMGKRFFPDMHQEMVDDFIR